MFEDDIIPSHLLPTNIKHDAFNNVTLRVGEVYEEIPPKDVRNLSKKVFEYRVYTQHRQNGTAVSKMYDHCILMNMFGAAADECTYKLRVDTDQDRRKKGISKGAKVLLLCINGETSNAVILGGIRDQSSTTDLDNADKGHFYHWVMNGISLDINDDGELAIKFGGKTKVDGKTDASDDTIGSTLTFTKEGHIKLDAKQKIIIKRGDTFELGDATDHMLLGESFRNAQQQMNTKLQSYCNTLQTLLQTAGTALQTAGTSMLVPTTGPVAAAPQITVAATAIISAATVASNMAQALSDFEQSAAQANSFLSRKNSAD